MDGLIMRFTILQHTSERLLRNVAIVLIAGFGAGCSADTMRFTDGIYTGSTPNQRSVLNKTASAPVIDDNYTGSIARTTPVSRGNIQSNALPPVAASSGPVVAAAKQAVMAPVVAAGDQAHGAVVGAQTVANNHVQGAVASASSVMVQPGESLYGIARRVGVSPNDLMRGNGITDPNRIQAGQQLKMPGASGVIAAASNAVNGTKEKILGQIPTQAPDNGVPRPADNGVAILPQTPAVKEKQAGATTVAANGATTTTPPAPGGTYTVRSGDSLFSIAEKHGVQVDAVKKANGLSSGAIRVGQALVIPSAERNIQVASVAPTAAVVDTVKTGSTPPHSAKTVPDGSVKPYTPPTANGKVMEEAEKDASVAPSSTGISQMRWPVRGKVLSNYGQREGTAVNDGIDIMVPEGTPVKAAENGVVIYSGDGLKEFGNTVLIRHDNGLVTVYGHNSSITVQRGQKVRRGEEIARSGMSGNAKSPKLHFEVRKNSTPVNPSKYLET